MHREHILLRDTADIHRAHAYVLSHWTLPHIEVSTERFPTLIAERAQDRCSRLADACNCLFGEVLGGATLLVGTATVWVSSRRWSDVTLVLLAAVGVLFVGKGVEIAWTRVRMLLVLGSLRRHLDSTRDMSATKPVGSAWIDSPTPAKLSSSTTEAEDIPAPGPRKPRAPRPKVELRNAADINRLCLQLATRWNMPRIEISVDGLSEQDAQRAHHHYVRLTDGATFMLAGVLAGLTLLGGALYVVMSSGPDASPIERPELWLKTLGWSDMQPVVLAALGAGILGWAIELVVIRVRLLKVLRRLRGNLSAAAPS